MVNLETAMAADPFAAQSGETPLGPPRSNTKRRRKKQVRRMVILGGAISGGVVILALSMWGIVTWVSDSAPVARSPSSQREATPDRVNQNAPVIESRRWKEFRSEQDNFAVLFPDPGFVETRTSESPYSELNKISRGTRYSVTTNIEGRDCIFGVSCRRGTLVRGSAKPHEWRVDRGKINFQLRPIELEGGHPGWYHSGDGMDSTLQEHRYLVGKDRAYFVYASTAKEDRNHPDIAKFLNSFRLLEPVTPVPLREGEDSP
ncbi:MAG: hypothetical protein JW818_18045 [Pirellulales bacterium]|nr:hypothetical protein [Pirellulales bacterium]